MLTKFPKLIKDILKPLPRNDYPVLNTFLFVSCWIGFALDKSLVSMRDLCTRINLQGINVQISTFSKASKIREIGVFEKIITELNKRLSNQKSSAPRGGVWKTFCSQTLGFHCKLIFSAPRGGELHPNYY